MFLIGDAPSSLVPMSVSELHLFAYLGCLLALFKGSPVSEWGYRFSVTREGFPFSAEFEVARKLLIRSSIVEIDDQGLMRPDPSRFDAEFGIHLVLRQSARRRYWLKIATQCALALPVGSIGHAIGRSPGFSQFGRHPQSHSLLEEGDVGLLYDEYKAVQSILGDDAKDLLSPAIIWLSARVLRDQVSADEL